MENNIWAKMMELPRPSELVPLPRIDPNTQEPYCEIRMVILTAEEVSRVTAEAEKKTRKKLQDALPGKDQFSQGYQELYRDFTIEGVLYHSCRLPNDVNKYFFPTQDSIFKVLTADEAGVLFNHYATIQAEFGPVIAGMTEDEMDMWIEKLQKDGKNSFFLNSFTSEQLKTFIMYMVNRLPNSPMDKS